MLHSKVWINFKRFSLASILLLVIGPAWANQPLSDDFLKTIDGIEIRKWAYWSDNLRVYGELYLPSGGERLPLVVFNHDGTSGISKEHRLSSVRLAKAGYVVFSPSYRGEDGGDGMIEIAKGEVRDVLNALRLLEHHPRVDRNRVALAGASHGALISVLAAAQEPDIKAVVAAYGVMDIHSWWYYLKRTGRLGGDGITERTYGKGPVARPLSFSIRSATAVVPKLKSPVLILQGKKDKIVPPEQAQKMQEVLKKHGKQHEVKIYPDCLHGFLVYVPFLEDEDIAQAEREQTEQAWKTMLQFLKKHLSPTEAGDKPSRTATPKTSPTP